MSETVTLADIERLCWHLSGWNVEQRSVDELLAAIRAHMGCECPAAPVVEEAPVSGPERPVGALEAAQSTMDPSEGTGGRETGVQRLHLTGTLTLVCSGTCTGARGQQAQSLDTPRTCRACGVTFPLADFPRDPHSPQGRRTACRDCERRRHREAAKIKREQKAQAA